LKGGNDSRKIVPEIKALLFKLQEIRAITRSEMNRIMEELLYLT